MNKRKMKKQINKAVAAFHEEGLVPDFLANEGNVTFFNDQFIETICFSEGVELCWNWSCSNKKFFMAIYTIDHNECEAMSFWTPVPNEWAFITKDDADEKIASIINDCYEN